ncbi:Zinc finger BED domain-containing protein 4 [Bienertia sinuspersici]
MAFGKKRGQQRDRIQSPQQNQPQNQPSTEEYIYEEEGIDQREDTAAANVANQVTLSDRQLLQSIRQKVEKAEQEAWKDWVNSGDERMKALGKEVANTISDELFWDEVENILTVTKPIYLMIKFADGEGPKMGEVWEKMNIPMHCLAFALNPYYYDANYLQIPAPGGEARRAPNYDKEVVQGVLDAFDKIGEDEEKRKVLRHQLVRFQAKEGISEKLQAKNDAVSLSPIKWWNTYGAETPELAEIAVKVLSQPISSSSAERVWSTYSFVHSIKRNRLNSLRVDKLVFIHSNIRLLSHFTASYKQGPHRKWDIELESSYLDDSVARLEDMRWEGEETNVAIPRAPKRQRYAD